MNPLVTSQLVEAHQHCPRKAFLLLRGNPEPHPHDYELVVEDCSRSPWNASSTLKVSPTRTSTT